MPELPEVETLCRQLRDVVLGQKIQKTVVYDPKIEPTGSVDGQKIIDVRRAGKTIEIHLADGRCLAVHLRMTGRLFLNRQDAKLPHTRWRMCLKAACIDLVDPRRFATVKIQKAPSAEPVNDLMLKFDERVFLEKHARRRVNVKCLLMDGRAVAGIGNIYACEILYRTGVSPAAQAATISPAGWKKIFRQARRILNTGIAKRGTSISDWRDLYGRKGENQHELQAYGREGQTCPICGGVIRRVKQGGRSTFYCPDCQKL